MNTATDKRAEREEIEMLLPWFVTGKLGDADTARVAAYLEQHPEMAERAALSQAERNETAHLNELAQDHLPADVDRFMARIAATRHDEGRSEAGVMAWLKGLFEAPFGGGLRWAGAVAVVVIAVQAVTLAALLVPRIVNDYEMAGTKPGALDGSFVLVRFADDASVETIAKMLSELEMTISDGPKAGGLFTVRIGAADLSADDRKARTAALSARRDLVVFVTATR